MSETWIRNNLTDADRQEEVRSIIRDKLTTEEIVSIDSVSQTLEADEVCSYKMFMSGIAEEEFKVDKIFVEKKLKRIRLNIDKEIDLYINNEAYKDRSKFEIIKNGDGSINMIIKNVKNYIEK